MNAAPAPTLSQPSLVKVSAGALKITNTSQWHHVRHRRCRRSVAHTVFHRGDTLLNALLGCGIVAAIMKKLLFLLTALGLVALVYLLDLLVFQYLGLDRHITGWWRIITDVCFALVVILLILVSPAMRLARKK